MNAFHRFFFLLLTCLASFSYAQSENPSETSNQASIENILFTPPPGWRNAESTALPKQVKLMVVGKGAKDFPPSISLATETYSGTVKEYLKIIKKLNTSKGHEWKDLGTIRTEAGNASLSQTDSLSQWGQVRMMHVILKKADTIYILTAAALKDEFPKSYKDIFASLRSLHFSSPISESEFNH